MLEDFERKRVESEEEARGDRVVHFHKGVAYFHKHYARELFCLAGPRAPLLTFCTASDALRTVPCASVP